MAWRDTDFSHHRWRVNHLRLTREDLLFGAYDINLYGSSHSCSLKIFGFFGNFFDAANHVKRLLGILVKITIQNRLESGNGIFQ